LSSGLITRLKAPHAAACAGAPERKRSGLACAGEHLAKAGGRHWRASLGREYVSGRHCLALELAQGTQFPSPERVHARHAVLDPPDVQQPMLEVDLIPAQGAHFRVQNGAVQSAPLAGERLPLERQPSTFQAPGSDQAAFLRRPLAGADGCTGSGSGIFLRRAPRPICLASSDRAAA
jgi:hypothetical protein